MDSDLALFRQISNHESDEELPVIEINDVELGNIKVYKNGNMVLDKKYSFRCKCEYDIPVIFDGFEYKLENIEKNDSAKTIYYLKKIIKNSEVVLKGIFDSVLMFYEADKREDAIKIKISASIEIDCDEYDYTNGVFVNTSFSYESIDDEECGYADLYYNINDNSIEEYEVGNY